MNAPESLPPIPGSAGGVLADEVVEILKAFLPPTPLTALIGMRFGLVIRHAYALGKKAGEASALLTQQN